jgi:hypothetical protein
MNMYCLKCERPGTCKCNNNEFRFRYSCKLRPPLSTKNKVVFRKFLDDCAIFPNCVSEEQRPLFLDLLRKVKYFNKAINGFEWTNIRK